MELQVSCKVTKNLALRISDVSVSYIVAAAVHAVQSCTAVKQHAGVVSFLNSDPGLRDPTDEAGLK